MCYSSHVPVGKNADKVVNYSLHAFEMFFKKMHEAHSNPTVGPRLIL